jgi:hypothetical protein
MALGLVPRRGDGAAMKVLEIAAEHREGLANTCWDGCSTWRCRAGLALTPPPIVPPER